MIDQESLLKALLLRERQLLQLNRHVQSMQNSRGWRLLLLLRRIKSFRLGHVRVKSTFAQSESNVVDKFVGNLSIVKPNLFLVNHETTLTGAPIVLLDLAYEIKKQDFFNVSIINVRHRGPDLDEKLNNFNTISLYDKNFDEILNVNDFIKLLFNTDSKAIFLVNTITLNSFTSILMEYGFVFYTWAHELELSWSVIGIENVRSQLVNSKKIIVDSEEIKDLIVKHSISNEVEFLENGISFKVTTEGNNLRDAYGLSKSDILITIAGSRSIRKGFDLFPYFIHKIKDYSLGENKKRKILIIWIGSNENTDLNFYVTKQLSSLVNDKLDVILLSSVVNYENYVNASNYFVSLSREDSASQTFFLAETLNISRFSLSRDNQAVSDVYTEIDIIAKKIVCSPFSEYSSKVSIGAYSTWNNYYLKLSSIILDHHNE